MQKDLSGNEIRKMFIDFFMSKGHKFVRSSSLVPGGDQTLLFTNAGMVQFKDVFLGTDKRDYTRAVNSQKCMRVAGKHNDLDDVGRDNTHHTFFEMLGNWSFGDYYKKEAIEWAWELLTDVWGIEKHRLWATCFKDEKAEIPADTEAYEIWIKQPGIKKDQILYFGRKDNLWEMAEMGPCGPCSEIHIDLGKDFCNKNDDPEHICAVNGNCSRFLELWNLVFIQYNRISETKLEPLSTYHVDTGMGFERIVSVLQGTFSNYKTDLLKPLMDAVQELTLDSNLERDKNITPYRVIADHARSSAFLIADGVVPGNTGRNYVCRMIIRRAVRFGTKIGLNEPFLAKISEKVIEIYGEAYPELIQNKKAILENITREEIRFKQTLDSGLLLLDEMLEELKNRGEIILKGEKAFELYATHGLPFEISKDIVNERGFDIDYEGFVNSLDEHRLASGVGKTFKELDGDDVEIFTSILDKLISKGTLLPSGVDYDPYQYTTVETDIAAIIKNESEVFEAKSGESIQLILPRTGFYLESGGQINDTGVLKSQEINNEWEISITGTTKPCAGIIVHEGIVTRGTPKVGDTLLAIVDMKRRRDIMRNHTATHLLHSVLQNVLGDHARQAGSLVAPDRLRFDFTHPEAISNDDLKKIELEVNTLIFAGIDLNIRYRELDDALQDGAMALFGEKYSENVRTVEIVDNKRVSLELCGGTHVSNTSDIGIFLIQSESSTAAGIRRIEAVTGRGAYSLIQKRNEILNTAAEILETRVEEVDKKLQANKKTISSLEGELNHIRQKLVLEEFFKSLDQVEQINDVSILAAKLPDASMETLRLMSDNFREKYEKGILVLGSVVSERPILIASVSNVLVERGINAGDIIKNVSKMIGGSGGGKPNLAQAGGKDPDKLDDAIAAVVPYLKKSYFE